MHFVVQLINIRGRFESSFIYRSGETSNSSY